MNKIKKFFIALFVISLFCTQCLTVFASAQDEIILDTEREYQSDGSYFETVTTKTVGVSRDIDVYSRTRTYHNASGVSLWYVKVTGTFNYNGITCTCTNAYSTAGSYSSSWKISSHSSSHVNNNAVAYATAKRYMSGIAVETMNGSVTLACDANGNYY